MKRGRKGYGEEILIKQYLAEITPKLFKVANEILDEGTKSQKIQILKALAPKIIDKALPSEMEHSGELKITWEDDKNNNNTIQTEEDS